MRGGGGGRGGGDWVACATVRLRNNAEILVPGPHGYQDLSNRNDWPVKNAIADSPIRMKGNSKHTLTHVKGPEQRSRRRFADVTNHGHITPATQAGEGEGGAGGGAGQHSSKSFKHSVFISLTFPGK